MSAEANSKPERRDRPFFSMASDLVNLALQHADNPGDVARLVTKELRALTGARTVALLQCQHHFGGQGHRVVGVFPERRRELAESAEVERLAELTHELERPALWTSLADGAEAEQLLARMECGQSIAAPLNVGATRMGCLLLLDLPEDRRGLPLVLDVLEMLSTTLALVFRNSLLYERQEAIIADRTRDLSEANEALAAALERAERGAAETSAVLERFQAVMDGLDALVYVADFETYEILFINKYGREHWGEITGEVCWRRLQEGQTGPCPFCTNVKLLDENGRPTGVYQWEFRNTFTGEWFDCRDQAIRWADGRLVRMEIASNLSERKQAEEARLSLERQVQHAQKLESLGVLAGGIAHDFNNLLMGILGNADLALEDLSPHSPARESIQGIETAARRAAALSRQMLAYSGKGRFVIEPIRLNEFVEEMAHLLEVSISKKVVLKYNFADNLPVFDGDATQIRQVLMNLITNASEAIGDSSGVVALSTGAMDCDREYLDGASMATRAGLEEPLPAGVYVYAEVADTGCGMDAETQQKIFDPFFTTKFTGRGLGMAAALGIVRGHKGAVKIYSEVGKGSTFKILFPAGDGPLGESAKLGAPALMADEWRGEGAVLVVDDEETVRTLAKRMLSRLGFTVLTAEDGREALEHYRAHADEIVCVLLDLTMPHMDGEVTFRELRRIREDVCVIMSSGYNEQDVTQRFAGKGLAGFIQKPYQSEALIAKLREVLERGQA